LNIETAFAIPTAIVRDGYASIRGALKRFTSAKKSSSTDAYR
jgi:hypothetical protein